MHSDFELIQMQTAALFVHDADGKLLCINEPEPTSPAPRFFLGRTAAGNLWRTRFDLPEELAAELEQLAADEPVTVNLQAPPRHAAEYHDLLEQHGPIRGLSTGPAYWLPEADPPPGVLLITPENTALVGMHFAWIQRGLDDYAPVAVVLAEGVAVAACFSSRITAQVCEAGVYTEAAYRGRGYAVMTTRGWAAAVHATGRLALYSTSWTNAAS